MMSKQSGTNRLQDRFLKGADAWMEAKSCEWQEYWLTTPPCLLEYARSLECVLDKETLGKLQDMQNWDHARAAGILYQGLCTPEPDVVKEQAASLMRGMIYGVRAALVLAHAGLPDPKAPPDEFIEDAATCCWEYQAAWPLGIDDPLSVVQNGTPCGSRPFEPNTDKIAVALQAVVNDGRIPGLRVSTWLAVRRLLEYLLKAEPSTKPEPVVASMLAYLPHVHAPGQSDGDGIVCEVGVQTQFEGQVGFYLDPVAMGLAQLDESMIQSLDLAWLACRPQLQKRFREGGISTLPAIRLAPNLSGRSAVWQLSGGSAGGLFACAMYAAATGTRLNTDASASVALRLREGATCTGDLDLADLEVDPVNKKSIGSKLLAAKEADLRRVVLTKEQAAWAEEKRRVPEGVAVVGAENLAEVFETLTGDARMERVIEAYCRRVCEEWDRALSTDGDLPHYVEPHYSLLDPQETDHPMDSSEQQRLQRPGDEEFRAPSYQPVAADGDSAEDELVKLMETSQRLCISEDSGAGKTVFTRRLQAFLCSPEGQARVLAQRPHLVVRFERRSSHWPENFRRDGLIARLAELIRDDCRELHPEMSPNDRAEEVAQWALDHGRVVLILDALDQVGDDACIESLHEFLTPAAECTPRVVLTCRSFAIGRWPELFDRPGWRHGRIEGFNVRQQVLCLWDVLAVGGLRPSTEDACPPEKKCRDAMAGVVANPDEVKELLRVPQVLAHIRRLHAEGRLRSFRSRGELYQEVEQDVLETAAERLLGKKLPDGHMRQLRRLMAAAAYEMMVRKHYDYAVLGDEKVNVQEAASRRCGMEYDPEHWEQIEQVSQCTNRALVEGSTERFFGFKHRGAMEYYCALHLIDNEQPNWVQRPTEEAVRAGEPPIRCGDPALGKALDDANWDWVFRFVIDLATSMPAVRTEPQASITLASLAELFLPRGRGSGQRPAKRIFDVWHLFEVDRLVLRERGLSMEQGREVLLPGAEQVLAYYRRTGDEARIIRKLKQNGFVRCPKDPEDDGKPVQMGCNKGGQGGNFNYWDFSPPRAVAVQPFEMQVTPVTRAQYRVFDPEWERNTPEYVPWFQRKDNCPATLVSWYDAFAFAKWLGMGYRLPTDAEWEYAYRAGSETKHYVDYDDYADHVDNADYLDYRARRADGGLPEYLVAEYGSQEYARYKAGAYGPLSVAIKLPMGFWSSLWPMRGPTNPWGLYDMHGNVYEWCWDWYNDWYNKWDRKGIPYWHPESNPTGPKAGSERVYRMGIGLAARKKESPEFTFMLIGFRVARVPADE